ncbi:T9SS type A sorting domain-containing protein, partial [bacterium]|nr:T9SS type A sorting domain-containing protein [bacterium]
FGQTTAISFQIPRPGIVDLAVYNIAGQKVRTLICGPQPAGRHSVRWDGRDGSGRALAGGVYLARLNADGSSRTEKLILVR